LAVACEEAGADELFLIARGAPLGSLTQLAERITSKLSIPLSVWMDRVSESEVGELLAAGAARLAIQSAALDDPNFISFLSRSFGSESIAVAIAAQREGERWRVQETLGGSATEWDPLTWAAVAEAQGAGAVIIESSGGREGEPFDLELLEAVASAVAMPVIAAGEPEAVEDVFDALMIGKAAAVLLDSRARTKVGDVKAYLGERGF
jgi:cyclase